MTPLLRWRLPAHAVAFIVLWVVLARLNVALDPLYSYYLALAAMYATAMLGMVVLVGLSGQVSLGNGALMAVGGYAFAVTTLNWTTVPLLGWAWTPVWAVVFAGLLGVLAGLVVGVIGARLRGPYLAGLTLGLAVGLPAVATRFPGLLGGPQGLILPAVGAQTPVVAEDAAAEAASDAEKASADEDALAAFLDGGTPSEMPPSPLSSSPLSSSPVPVDSPVDSPVVEPGDAIGTLGDAATGVDATFVLQQYQASVAIAVACIAGFVALNLVRGRSGRAWRAVRDDPVAASVVGISPAQSKVLAFVVSSLFAALAGAVFAQILTYVGPGAFGVGLSLSLLVGVVLGGRSSLVGAVIGAVAIVGLPNLVQTLSSGRDWDEQVVNNMPNLMFGLLLVAVVLVAPLGITGLARSAWRRFAQR